MRYRTFELILLMVLGLLACAAAHGSDLAQARVKDIPTNEGIRDNPLIGYGLVIGLKNSGDSTQAAFSTHTLSNVLPRMGLHVPATAMRVHNVDAVFFTAA